MSPCAAPNCTAPAKPGQLMCWDCWKRTPRPLQRAVNAAWRNVRRDTQSYREARDAAIAWHRDNPISTQGSMF